MLGAGQGGQRGALGSTSDSTSLSMVLTPQDQAPREGEAIDSTMRIQETKLLTLKGPAFQA